MKLEYTCNSTVGQTDGKTNLGGRHMKKIIAMLLAVIMVLSMSAMFAGCQESSNEPGKVYYLNFKPEFNDALQNLAKTYTEKTGIKVTVVTAASGTYSDMLTAEMAKSEAPTIFNIGNSLQNS